VVRISLPPLLISLVALSLSGLLTLDARAATEDPDVVEETAPTVPDEWEVLGLEPHRERLLAGLRGPLALAVIGSLILYNPAQAPLFFGLCYGAGLCPDTSAWLAVYMAGAAMTSVGCAGTLAWAYGQDHGKRTGLQGADLVRWREGVQAFAIGATLVLTGAMMTFADPTFDPIEPNGTVTWTAGLTSAGLGAALLFGGQAAMDQALGRRRARSPLPIVFGAAIFAPKLVVGVLALSGVLHGCRITEIRDLPGGGTAVSSTCGPMPLPQVGWPSLGWAAVGASMVVLELATTRPGTAAADATVQMERHGAPAPRVGWPTPLVQTDGEDTTVGFGLRGSW